MEKKIWFRNICKRNGLEISDIEVDSIEKFSVSLLEWNKKINLISRRDEENIWSKHILGSIALLFRYQLESGSLVLDLGTGGGLPGIPLSIVRPDLKFTLVDSIQKKIRAVSDIVETLKLSNVKTICSRVEELSQKKEFKQSFDYIISRAVGPIVDIVGWGKQLLKPSGQVKSVPSNSVIEKGAILLLKGGELTDEIEAAKQKTKPRHIFSFPIIIDGLDSTELADKKLVIVYP